MFKERVIRSISKSVRSLQTFEDTPQRRVSLGVVTVLGGATVVLGSVSGSSDWVNIATTSTGGIAGIFSGAELAKKIIVGNRKKRTLIKPY